MARLVFFVAIVSCRTHVLGFAPRVVGRRVGLASNSFAGLSDLEELENGLVTELPDSFDAACVQAVSSTLAANADGWQRLQLTFDTSAGDATYTLLKSSLPFSQKYLQSLVPQLLAQMGSSENATVRLYFPDAGSAALAQRDWKVPCDPSPATKSKKPLTN
jgi:hypothetical protein